jgi:hypothetical protein
MCHAAVLLFAHIACYMHITSYMHITQHPRPCHLGNVSLYIPT